MNRPAIVAPVALQHTQTVTCTAPWYVQGSEYHPVEATYQPLINGEAAFKAVHLAIASASTTVDIICWGFQPSMYFIRDGKSPSIGELLKAKAREGVRVRVLTWEMPLNAAGVAGEANLPGKGTMRIGDRALQTSTQAQYDEDRRWFAECSVSDSKAAGQARHRDGLLECGQQRDTVYLHREPVLPLAEAIKKAAADQTGGGRDPGVHGSLHLFVITNATEDGMGAGTLNTQRMLESLGRADTIPGVTKLRRIERMKAAAPLGHRLIHGIM